MDADILMNTGYIVQAETGAGEWVSLDHRYPRADISQYALEVGTPSLLRFVFLGRHTIRNLGTRIVSGQPDRIVRPEIVRAMHSRFGDMRSRLRWADGVSAGIEPGDTLEVEVRVPTSLTMNEPAFLLVTKGYYSDPRGTTFGLQDAMGHFVNALSPARPNPMRAGTAFSFQLQDSERGTFRMYDVAGRLVKTLVDGQLEAGPHELVWDGRDEAGRAMPSGLYFYRLTIPGWSREGKVTMVR